MLWPWESTSVPFCSLDLKVSSTLASLNVCPIPTAENKRFPQTAPTCPRLFTIYTEAVLFVHVLWASLSHIWTQVLWWRTAARKTPFAWCLMKWTWKSWNSGTVCCLTHPRQRQKSDCRVLLWEAVWKHSNSYNIEEKNLQGPYELTEYTISFK